MRSSKKVRVNYKGECSVYHTLLDSKLVNSLSDLKISRILEPGLSSSELLMLIFETSVCG